MLLEQHTSIPYHTIPHAVNHSLALLRMGKELSETFLANLKTNKLLLLHLVGHLRYLCMRCKVKFTSDLQGVWAGILVRPCQCSSPVLVPVGVGFVGEKAALGQGPPPPRVLQFFPVSIAPSVLPAPSFSCRRPNLTVVIGRVFSNFLFHVINKYFLFT
jgi:hypothetical protein